MNAVSVARAIHTLEQFCGPRDAEALTPAALQKATGEARADVMVLFGGSILYGGDVFAEAMKADVARAYMIVGGEGHTTQALRDALRALYPDVNADGLPEADVFALYIQRKYGLAPDLTERASTNCGNNITLMLEALHARGIAHGSMILCQDATMQRRMCAGLRKYAPDTRIVNYAAYSASVVANGETLAFAREIPHMWTMDRYVSLLMGEIPRLTDDENGYGPKGRGFIAHVDVPEDVRRAYARLKTELGDRTREANPAYASVSRVLQDSIKRG